MAFFKFRFSGKTPAAVTEGLAATPGQSMEVLRRRARHRLLGAVVLVFVAVVAFPLLFDSQPRPAAVDTSVVIPDRNATPPLAPGVAVPAAQAPARPLLAPASSELTAQASLEPGKEEIVPAPAVKAHADNAPDSKHETAVPGDAQKAKALLEGKSGTDIQSGRLTVQVGAFLDADKVREVRRKLELAGLKTYTQTLPGSDGKRTTRVRVGPFDTRAEADKAAAQIRKLDLPANVIVL